MTQNPLTDFVGDLDPKTARALAAVETACQAGMAAQPHDVSPDLLAFCTWYRIAAIHDRDRLARAVDVVRRLEPRSRLLDVAVAIMSYDARRCGHYPYIGSEVYDLSPLMYLSRTYVSREVYDTYMTYVPLPFSPRRPKSGIRHAKRELDEAFSSQPVVRTDALFNALFHAVAEQIMRDDIDAVIQPGRDIDADMAVAGHRGRDGGFSFDPEPGDWFSSVDDALNTGANRLFGVAPEYVDNDPGFSPNDVLTRHWSPVLLDRAGELAATYIERATSTD